MPRRVSSRAAPLPEQEMQLGNKAADTQDLREMHKMAVLDEAGVLPPPEATEEKPTHA